MKLSQKEKAALKAAFRSMTPGEKAEYILTYYKWPILLGLLALAVLCSGVYRRLTEKEPVLYVGFVNTVAGEDLKTGLTSGYLSDSGLDLRRKEVYTYEDLYLTDDADTLSHEYAYASRMKVLAAVNAGKLDVVFTNREGYDLLSRAGYLLDLGGLLRENDPQSAQRLEPLLTENAVVISDNSLEVLLNEAEEADTVTENAQNGLPLSGFPLFREAGFDGEVYLTVIANSSRRDSVISYIRYLCG